MLDFTTDIGKSLAAVDLRVRVGVATLAEDDTGFVPTPPRDMDIALPIAAATRANSRSDSPAVSRDVERVRRLGTSGGASEALLRWFSAFKGGGVGLRMDGFLSIFDFFNCS